MRLTWTHELPAQPEFRELWNELVFQMEKPEVFYTWEWAAAVVSALKGGALPWIATAYEGDELVGVVALAKASETEAVFLAGTTADYCDFVSRPAQRKEFVDAVLNAVREAGIRSVVLANLPADSATAAALQANDSFNSFLRTGYICAQVQLGHGEERKSLADSLLKKKMYRRSINTLQRIGPVSLQHDRGAGLERGVVERFCVTHVARFLATGRLSNLVSAARRDFLRQLAGLLAEKGWFDLSILRAGSWVLALNYGFRFQGSWFWYQPTIVNKFDELSPGYCLLAKIVEDASRDSEAHMVDLGLGAEGYKERFANGQRTTLHATLSRGRINLWTVKGRYRAAETIKKRPWLESFARGVQSRLQGGRERMQKNGLASTLARAGSRLRESVIGIDEVFLFQWPIHGDPGDRPQKLVPLTWEILATAAMRYANDSETMEYLLRSSARFRSIENKGYALPGEDGVAQHFVWVGPYQGFVMDEVKEVLHAPSENSVMIFDCWTPRELRGRGLYARAIGQLAALQSAAGKDAWIFSAAANPASVAGIEKAGFQKRTSLVRRKVLGLSKTRQKSHETPLVQSVKLSDEAAR